MKKPYKSLLGLLFLAPLAFCINKNRHIDNEPPKSAPDSISYETARQRALQQKEKLKLDLDSKRISEDSAAKAFTEIMVNGIIPYWYGTAWDFNGYTATPKNGVIACGYFVSTTLLHAGLKLNRYKMAQKSSMDGALMLEPKDSLYIKHGNRDEFLILFNKKMKNGLYMVGLSQHVGFLYKGGGDTYFIHSNYISPGCVCMEKAAESAALSQSTIFVVADITYNKPLIKKWLNGETVPH